MYFTSMEEILQRNKCFQKAIKLKKKARCGSAHLQSQCWGGKDRWVPEARWLANLDYIRNSRPLGDPVLKTRWMATVEWHPRLTSGFQISAYMYTYKHSGVQTAGVALISQIWEAKGAWCCPCMSVLCLELSYWPRTHFLACGCFWGYPPLLLWKMWAIDDELLLFLHTPDSLLSCECWAGYKQAGLDKHHDNLAMSISHPMKGWQHRGWSRFQHLKDSLWIKLALFPVLTFYSQCKVTEGLRLTKWEHSDACLFVTSWLQWQSGSMWKIALRAAMLSASASLSAEALRAETRNTKNKAAKARWSKL